MVARSAWWSGGKARGAVLAVNAAGVTAAAGFAAVGLLRPSYVRSGASSSSLAEFWAASSAVRTWAVGAPLLLAIVRGDRPAPALFVVAGLVQLGDGALGVWQRDARMAAFPTAMGLVHLASARVVSR